MKKSYSAYGILAIVVVVALVIAFKPSNESKYLKAAVAGGDYLVSHMHEDGSFVYEYDPVAREESDSYNIVRHAGTTYALLELFETTEDLKYLSAATDALLYLMASSDACPGDSEAVCIIEGDEIKLGGNGLALLAVTKYLEVGDTTLLARIGTSLVREDLETWAKGLARAIVDVQKSSGEFFPHKTDLAGVPDPNFTSEYYPGEAMFALARLSEVTGDRAWLDAAHKGALWIINVRDKNVATNDLPHDHWFLYALNELFKDTQDLSYLDHAKRLTTAIVAAQHQGKTGEQEDWNGGYYNPPRSTPTATRNEGLGAAHELFTRSGDAAYAVVAKDAMERGVGFTLRTQFTAKKIRDVGAKKDARGGFHESLDDYTIRIDYVQHNISALLAFDRISKGE